MGTRNKQGTRARDALTRAVHESYAALQIFCMLGYEPDDVFISAGPVVGQPTKCARVRLDTGDRSFTILTGRLNDAQADAFRDAYLAFQESKSENRTKLDRIVKGSEQWGRLVEILAAMQRKGFDISRLAMQEAN